MQHVKKNKNTVAHPESTHQTRHILLDAQKAHDDCKEGESSHGQVHNRNAVHQPVVVSGQHPGILGQGPDDPNQTAAQDHQTDGLDVATAETMFCVNLGS